MRIHISTYKRMHVHDVHSQMSNKISLIRFSRIKSFVKPTCYILTECSLKMPSRQNVDNARGRSALTSV